MRVLYEEFSAFARDQERLISGDNNKFDYVEGFVIINRTGLLNSWGLSFAPEDPLQASQFKSDGRTLYCLEVAKYFKLESKHVINQVSPRQKEYTSSFLTDSQVTRHDTDLSFHFPGSERIPIRAKLHVVDTVFIGGDI